VRRRWTLISCLVDSYFNLIPAKTRKLDINPNMVMCKGMLITHGDTSIEHPQT